MQDLCTDIKRFICSFMSLQDVRQMKCVSKQWYVLFQDDYTWCMMCERLGFLNNIYSGKSNLMIRNIINTFKGMKWYYLSKVYNTHTGCFMGKKEGKLIECTRQHAHNRCKCHIYRPYSVGFENQIRDSSPINSIVKYEGEWNNSVRNGFGVLTVYTLIL